jgi:hypothetical protein
MDHARPSSRRRVYGDLRQLADELQVGDFSALSAGIGIGKTKARSPSCPAPEVRRASVERFPTPPKAAGNDGGPVARVGDPSAGRSAADAPRPSRVLPIELKLVAWGTDLLFVALMTATALALAALLAAMRGGDAPLTIDEWLAVRPVQWLAGLSVYAALGGLYGIYGGYMLLFKVVAGRTLGESLFLRFSLVRKG